MILCDPHNEKSFKIAPGIAGEKRVRAWGQDKRG